MRKGIKDLSEIKIKNLKDTFSDFKKINIPGNADLPKIREEIGVHVEAMKGMAKNTTK